MPEEVAPSLKTTESVLPIPLLMNLDMCKLACIAVSSTLLFSLFAQIVKKRIAVWLN